MMTDNLLLLDFLVSELMAARLLSVREQYPAENGIAEEEDVSSIVHFSYIRMANREFRM